MHYHGNVHNSNTAHPRPPPKGGFTGAKNANAPASRGASEPNEITPELEPLHP